MALISSPAPRRSAAYASKSCQARARRSCRRSASSPASTGRTASWAISAALVLEHIIRIAKPKTIVFSTFGVREGLLYDKLTPVERAKDGLISATTKLNELMSRSARHGEELTAWTDRFFNVVKLRESEDERRL